jgi:hypothetical protein
MNETSIYRDDFGHKHNGLFRPGSDFRLNACVGRNGGPADFGRIARGFFEAGKCLVASLEVDRLNIDLLVYPIVFNYRHGLEAALKYLVKRLPRLFGERGVAKPNHDLLVNWGKVRGYLERPDMPDDQDREWIETVERRLREFAEIDPQGECFRYPEAKDGSPYLRDTSLISIEVFGSQIDEVASFLDGLMSMADYYIDLRNEWLAEQAYQARSAYADYF